jgi:hypothetical protein
MKRLLIVSIFILALPTLVSVNNYEPSPFAALAGRTVAGAGWCDYCSSPPGTCLPDGNDPSCNQNLTVDEDATDTKDAVNLSSGAFLVLLGALMISRFISVRAL